MVFVDTINNEFTSPTNNDVQLKLVNSKVMGPEEVLRVIRSSS